MTYVGAATPKVLAYIIKSYALRMISLDILQNICDGIVFRYRIVFIFDMRQLNHIAKRQNQRIYPFLARQLVLQRGISRGKILL